MTTSRVTFTTTVFTTFGFKLALGSFTAIVGVELGVKPPDGVLREMVAVVLPADEPLGPVTFLREIV